MRKLKIILPTVLAISSLPLVSLVSCGAPKAENFETDPWSTVCYYANKGIDALAKAYGHENEPEWFVGQKREITLNGFTHHVKVVGINQDFTDLNHQKPVTLTFQFNNLISRAADGTYLTLSWEADETNSDNHDYWTSTLINALNSNKNVEWNNDRTEHQSVYSMIKEGDSTLAKNIKDVYRGVNIYNGSIEGDNKYELSSKKTKLFCPTLSNIFSPSGIDNSNIEYTGPGQKALFEGEGQPHESGASAQYMFYTNKIVDQIIRDTDWHKYSSLALKDVANDGKSGDGSCDYWITSVIIAKQASGLTSWSIQKQGYMNDKVNVATSLAIAPCFCI